ncbi:hypothetical protein CIB48_g5290 [Xylaria polymorpha]|nr:hypothetical protein CIB48_g5290 [Xylaria polymorpha]
MHNKPVNGHSTTIEICGTANRSSGTARIFVRSGQMRSDEIRSGGAEISHKQKELQESFVMSDQMRSDEI